MLQLSWSSSPRLTAHRQEDGENLRFAPSIRNQRYSTERVGVLTRLLSRLERSSWYVSASRERGRYLSTSNAILYRTENFLDFQNDFADL